MEVLVVHAGRCKNCKYCVHCCPKGALSAGSGINSKGYPPVEVDRDKCVVCGICYNVCPDYVFEVREEGA